ncbi:hypothetical protein ACFL2V_11555 [Pseudomonadota bacterium]
MKIKIDITKRTIMYIIFVLYFIMLWQTGISLLFTLIPLELFLLLSAKKIGWREVFICALPLIVFFALAFAQFNIEMLHFIELWIVDKLTYLFNRVVALNIMLLLPATIAAIVSFIPLKRFYSSLEPKNKRFLTIILTLFIAILLIYSWQGMWCTKVALAEKGVSALDIQYCKALNLYHPSSADFGWVYGWRLMGLKLVLSGPVFIYLLILIFYIKDFFKQLLHRRRLRQ